MKRLGMVGLALIIVGAAPVSAAAQRCAGTASFAGGGPQFSGGMSFTPNATSYGAGITLGKNNSLFGGASALHTTYNHTSLISGGLQAKLGYQFAVGSRAQICPLVSVGRASTMMYPGHGRTDWSTTGVGYGAMIGFVAASSKHVEFIPSLGLEYVTATTRASHDAYGTQLASGKWTGSAGNLSLTSGFVFRKAITVSPRIAIPLGVDHAPSMYGIGLAYNFGHDR